MLYEQWNFKFIKWQIQTQDRTKVKIVNQQIQWNFWHLDFCFL